MNELEFKKSLIKRYGLKISEDATLEQVNDAIDALIAEREAKTKEETETELLKQIEEARKSSEVGLTEKEVQKIANKALKTASTNKVYISQNGQPFHAENHCKANSKAFYFECEKVGTQTKVNKIQK